jgi:hypothetical protein
MTLPLDQINDDDAPRAEGDQAAAPAPDAWSIDEEARRISISRRHLEDLVKQHRIEILKAGRRTLFDAVSHAQLVDAMRIKPEPGPDNGVGTSNGRLGRRGSSAWPPPEEAYRQLMKMTTPTPRKKPTLLPRRKF